MYGYTVLANGGIMRGQQPFVAHNADERKSTLLRSSRSPTRKARCSSTSSGAARTSSVVGAELRVPDHDILSDPSAQCATFGCGGISVPGYKSP